MESLFNAQLDELDNLQSEMTSINHRLTSAEGFISNAFMLKFRGLPRKPMRIVVRSQVTSFERKKAIKQYYEYSWVSKKQNENGFLFV